MGKLEYMKKYNQQQNSENEQFVEKKHILAIIYQLKTIIIVHYLFQFPFDWNFKALHLSCDSFLISCRPL